MASSTTARFQSLGSLAYSLVPYVITVALSVSLLVPLWHLRHVDITVPLEAMGDANFSQELVTNFIRDGHYYINPLVGAPGEQELYDFPLPHWTHLIILISLKLFTRNPGLAINLFYLLGYPLVAVTSLYAFRRLGISTGLAIAGSVLYAFIPFHHMRNESHLIYSGYYIVPLMAMVAVWVSTGRDLFRFGGKSRQALPTARVTRDGLIGLVVCILLGWDNPYNVFFGAALLAVAALLGQMRSCNSRAFLSATIFMAVLITAFGVGLLPNLIYAHRHGRLRVAERTPAESEVYAMTIIQMLAPVTNHRIAALSRWKDRFNAEAILVNENKTAALGALGSAGFLVLLACLFLKQCPDGLYAISILNLFAVLLGTMGGFGAVFSFVVSPQLRAFNRISVYVSFFCIGGLLLAIDYLALGRFDGKAKFLGLVVIPAALLIFGIFDQVPRGLMIDREQAERAYREDGEFVRRIEGLVPPRSMIFQLPYDPFPESPPVYQLADYEELIGYLHSSSLRWSYGAMKGREDDRWIAAVAGQAADKMLLSIAGTGFAGVYIDRAGYADHAASLESQIGALLGSTPLVSTNGRLSFFLLDQDANASLYRQTGLVGGVDMDRLLHPPVATPGAGCWGKEQLGPENWHWCGKKGSIEIFNASKSQRKVLLETTFATTSLSYSNLIIDGGGVHQKLRINSNGTHWQTTVAVPPGALTLQLSSNAERTYAPADPREMFFRINNFRYREAQH